MAELSEHFEKKRFDSASRTSEHGSITAETRKWSWGKSLCFMITVSAATWVGILTVLMA